jgi:outer membrane lipoprotein-sorting protein
MIRRIFRVSGLAAALCVLPVLANQAIGESAAPKVPPKPPVTVKPPAPIDPAVAVQKANSYLNQTQTMIADFVQVAGDGRRSEGKLLLQKPGRLRFEYAAPATLDIIADGTSVAVVDRKMATQDLYFIWQTPLKFLLKEQIDLAHDVSVVEVTNDANAVSILIEDKNTFGGTSHVKLLFDPAKFTLKQWQVTDPQGNETLVSLFNVDTVRKPDPATFKIFQ